jgi:hypothetical protein
MGERDRERDRERKYMIEFVSLKGLQGGKRGKENNRVNNIQTQCICA